jgi:hypothetical protein
MEIKKELKLAKGYLELGVSEACWGFKGVVEGGGGE